VSTLLDERRERPLSAPLTRVRPASVTGWGGGRPCTLTRWVPAGLNELRAELPKIGQRFGAGAIARGAGRSYGDAAQRAGGIVVDTTALKGIVLDTSSGVANVGAGVTIGELLAASIQAGWIVPVVPGTQHVTIAGAIASDIHGKNHAALGTFGAHVRELTLISADGELSSVRAGAAHGLFEATLGGMGLTGVIVSAEVSLRRVPGPMLAVDTDRARDLDAILALLEAPGGEHRVAWLDLLCRDGPRGVVTRAMHSDLPGRHGADVTADVTKPARATVPAGWPGGLLRTEVVRAHNELRFRLAPERERGRAEPFGAHMFPLDVLDSWPRLYGDRGLIQYQLVVPRDQDHAIRTVIERLRRFSVPCYLAVLKDFGPAGPAPLSFPITGWTLALDLPRRAPAIDAALDGCDRIVAEAGGRVYLSKDARLGSELTSVMYPRLSEWRAARDRMDPNGLWCSDLALRTGLVDGRCA
jgi:decaprenylphospho-beta-D-ribofuranose 2-oxidase